MWTKENNPHTQGIAHHGEKKTKKTTKKAARATVQQFIHKGVKQVGDVRLWNDKNVEAYYRLVYIPITMVGPGDIVDDVDPKQRYAFYCFSPSQNEDSARELDRLRRAGYVKCVTPRFCSPTEKYESRDGVLVLGQGIWYACPEARWRRNQAEDDSDGNLIANAYADLAASAAIDGMSATAQTRNDSRGQRLK